MGVVYKAEDTKLKRDVAVKFLPRQIAASEEDRKRFKIEAQAAAALNHPNIATIHAIEEIEGDMFIVMEYIDGKELKEIVGAKHSRVHADTISKINEQNASSLQLENIVTYAIQIASGLQTAHEKGITHRDIKSANIMITDKGQVKIMDFGLAKIAGGAQLTKVQSTLGTAAYMSPEQARGEEVDQRSDIWSFGVVLYEMLTSQLPFKGDYEQAVIYSILNEDPQPVAELRNDFPEDLESIVNKCLQKEAKDRYQNTEDLLTDLQKIAVGTGSKSGNVEAHRNVPLRKRTFLYGGIAALILLSLGGFLLFGPEDEAPKERVPIAVVDFVNQTNEPELDGLSGMLITALEQSRRLDVMSRARMYEEFKQMGRPELTFVDEATGREIAKRANIAALAVATIRKFGQLYTVDFKVIDPQTGDRIFSTKVEGNGQESIPGLLDELSDKTRIDLSEQDNIVLIDRFLRNHGN